MWSSADCCGLIDGDMSARRLCFIALQIQLRNLCRRDATQQWCRSICFYRVAPLCLHHVNSVVDSYFREYTETFRMTPMCDEENDRSPYTYILITPLSIAVFRMWTKFCFQLAVCRACRTQSRQCYDTHAHTNINPGRIFPQESLQNL